MPAPLLLPLLGAAVVLVLSGRYLLPELLAVLSRVHVGPLRLPATSHLSWGGKANSATKKRVTWKTGYISDEEPRCPAAPSAKSVDDERDGAAAASSPSTSPSDAQNLSSIEAVEHERAVLHRDARAREPPPVPAGGGSGGGAAAPAVPALQAFFAWGKRVGDGDGEGGRDDDSEEDRAEASEDGTRPVTVDEEDPEPEPEPAAPPVGGDAAEEPRRRCEGNRAEAMAAVMILAAAVGGGVAVATRLNGSNGNEQVGGSAALASGEQHAVDAHVGGNDTDGFGLEGYDRAAETASKAHPLLSQYDDGILAPPANGKHAQILDQNALNDSAGEQGQDSSGGVRNGTFHASAAHLRVALFPPRPDPGAGGASPSVVEGRDRGDGSDANEQTAGETHNGGDRDNVFASPAEVARSSRGRSEGGG